MINADEHKKLLAQITELEKNSVNYFDVEKEFFLIDSNNLSQVRPRLYGYSIQRSGIYEDDNLTPEAIAGLDGRGCYIYVDVKDGEITIKQDVNGCWGIYLFRHGDYFALSNSFFRLLDHIKFKYPLTVNRDFCNYLLVNPVCSHTYLETAINEIQLVDRSAILTINIKEKTFQSELINYKEYSVPLDSKEGIANLDRWVEFWSKVFCGVAQHTKFISADLSGGFDSRISLAILLHSNIDLSKIRINSIKDDLHTHKEDYEIATKIAEHYSFQLNKSLPARQFLNYGINDIFNFNSYGWQTFTNIPKYSPVKLVDKMYYIDGSGGEMLRRYWHMSPKKFIENQNWQVNFSTRNLSSKLFHSIKIILESGFRAVCDKYSIRDSDSIDISQLLYYETRRRHHFGKGVLSSYLHNIFTFSPAIDPELCTLKLNTSDCPDYNLLIALIFTRYEPDLLTFPFNSNRSIAPETIEYAKKINERFPLAKKDKASISGGGFSSAAA